MQTHWLQTHIGTGDYTWKERPRHCSETPSRGSNHSTRPRNGRGARADDRTRELELPIVLPDFDPSGCRSTNSLQPGPGLLDCREGIFHRLRESLLGGVSAPAFPGAAKANRMAFRQGLLVPPGLPPARMRVGTSSIRVHISQPELLLVIRQSSTL